MNVRDPQPAGRPVPPASPMASPAVDAPDRPGSPAALVSYDAEGRFRFHSERDRIAWLRRGYRQGTNPDAFAQGTPLPPAEEALYASGAVEPPAHVFQGPDGKYRGKNAATRETPDVLAARMQAWEGLRFKDVDPLSETHPGEDAAVELMMKRGDVLSLGEHTPTPSAHSETGRESLQTTDTKDPNSQSIAPLLSLDDVQTSEFAPTEVRYRPLILNPSALPMPKTPPSRLPKLPIEPDPPLNETAPAQVRSPRGPLLSGLEAEAKSVDQDDEVRADAMPYNPFDNRYPIRLWRASPHRFSPEGAAGDALDLLDQVLKDKAPDWQELGGNPEQSFAEYRDAVDTVLDRAQDWYQVRFKDAASPADSERMRRYIEPRLLHYFPEFVQQQIRDAQESRSQPLEIKNGAQDLTTILRSFYYGNLVEIKIDDEPAYVAKVQPATASQKRPGSRGSIITTKYNDLVQETVDEHLKECFGRDSVEHVGGGQKYEPQTGRWHKVKELYIPDTTSTSTKGSKRSDLAFKIRFGDIDCIFHVNTADVVNGKHSERERINAAKMRENFKNLVVNLGESTRRWRDRFEDGRLAPQNALMLTDKPRNDDEVALRKALKELAKLLDCGRIEAECRASDQFSTPAP